MTHVVAAGAGDAADHGRPGCRPGQSLGGEVTTQCFERQRGLAVRSAPFLVSEIEENVVLKYSRSQQESAFSGGLAVLAYAQSAPALSLQAQVGEKLFHDVNLSASKQMSCASCHDPNNHYAQSVGNTRSVQLGWPEP